MRYILILLMLSITTYTCKAQNPIIDLGNSDDGITPMDMPDNGYYKDVNNELDNFVGTWLYTGLNRSLKIVLAKKTMYFNGSYYEDIMVGGYQYIEAGVEKINTLTDVNNDNPYVGTSIGGNNLYDDCFLIPADDCVEGEKRLSLGIKDPLSPKHFGNIILHKRTVIGQQALKAMINIGYHGTLSEGEEVPLPTIPSQLENIIFIKQ